MDLSLSNRDFCLFLLMQFPFAVHDEWEMTLDEYMMSHFEMPSQQWFDDLTGGTDENGHENTPWDGYTYRHSINDEVSFYAAFYPLETVYFFNDTYLGNTGGHFHLSLFRWTELLAIINNDGTDASLHFLLLLPLTIGREAERPSIEAEISRHLAHTALNLTEEQVAMLVSFLSRHLIFPDPASNFFQEKEHIGFVTQRNHSERNQHRSDEHLSEINQVIRMAAL